METFFRTFSTRAELVMWAMTNLNQAMHCTELTLYVQFQPSNACVFLLAQCFAVSAVKYIPNLLQ